MSAFSLKITEARTNARRWETHGDARRDTASDFLRYPALVEEQRFCDVKIIIDGMRRHEGDAAVQEEGRGGTGWNGAACFESERKCAAQVAG